MKLKDRVVIVTGGGKGIGKAAVFAFAEEGALVVCNSITDSGKEVAEKAGPRDRCLFVQADVSSSEGAQKVILETVAAFGRIDILFNNAGIVIPGTLQTTTVEEWDRTMNANVRSTFMMSAFALDYLKKTHGCIINNASSVALKGVASRLAYSASKGAVVSLTRAMSVECLPFGIRVNCICPGTTDTPSLRSRISSDADPERARMELVGRQPIGRLGSPDEIAAGVLYLARASFCTGTVLAVDGGMTA